MEKVSVILPSYNRGEKCINTVSDVLNQTHGNIELIILNDGSDPEHTKIIENYLSGVSDERVRYFYHENIGQAKSLNKGLDLVTGEYITWVSDDNKISSSYVEELIKLDADFAYSYYSVKQGKHIIRCRYYSAKRLINGFLGMAAFMWRRGLIEKIGYYNEGIGGLCADYDYEIRTFLATKNIKRIEKPLIDFYTGGDTQTARRHNLIKKTHKTVQKFYNIYLDKFANKDKIVVCYDKITHLLKFNDSYAKFYICATDDADDVSYKKDVLIIPRKYEELVFNILRHSTNEHKEKDIIIENDETIFMLRRDELCNVTIQ